jgi:hypothetical protein
MNPDGKRNIRKVQEIINIIAHEVGSFRITFCGYRNFILFFPLVHFSARSHVLRESSDVRVLGLRLVE